MNFLKLSKKQRITTISYFKSIIILFVITFGVFYKVIGQNCDHKVDTVFVILMTSTLKNGRPISSYALFKQLNYIPQRNAEQTMEEYLCKLFANSIAFAEPYLTVEKFTDCYKFADTKQRNKFFNSLYIRLNKMNKCYTNLRLKKFSDGRVLQIKCLKLIGDFWVLNKEMKEINGFDHSFIIRDTCYDKNFYYNLKNIIEVKKLDDIVKKELKSKLLVQ